MYVDTPEPPIKKDNRSLRAFLGLPARSAVDERPVIQGRTFIQDIHGGALQTAFDTVMKSTDFQEISKQLDVIGGLTIEHDGSLPNRAHWNSPNRTIRINLDRMNTADPEEIAGVLAFELSNAYHDEAFRALMEEVRVGSILSTEEYVKKSEAIEYQSAKLRADAQIKMLKAGKWTSGFGPEVRHFLEEGELLEDNMGRVVEGLVGDGTWLTLEGYLEYQDLSGHSEAPRKLFEKLDRTKEAAQALKIAQAKERLAKRRAQKEEQERLEKEVKKNRVETVEKSAAVTDRPATTAAFDGGYKGVNISDLLDFFGSAELGILNAHTSGEVVVRGLDGVWYKRIKIGEKRHMFAAYGSRE
ncbi:MAG: hypothetical protein AB3N09_00255 [Tateyamaria sp.]